MPYALDITGIRRPGLRFEVAGGRRLVLWQGGAVVLLGSVESDRCGVRVHRAEGYRSPVAPIPVAVARAASSGPDTARSADRWAGHFERELTRSSDGPLHDGPWRLSSTPLPGYLLHGDLVRDHPEFYLDWLAGWHGVVPLKPLPAVGFGRVKALRKQARDGTLPPLLLLESSGLAGLLLLDGHCRLVAAQAEGVEPATVVLGRGPDPAEQHAAAERGGARFAEFKRRWEASAPMLAQLRRNHADELTRIDDWTGRSRAWPLPGGVPAWQAQAQA
ncbi:hypothetical protein ACWKSP_01330 [Micromonosporaceae bacterium Da 78-11]